MFTALIIEDNEDNIMIMTLLLENAGYRVLKAETGEGGYSLAVKSQPDFILLDIQLPDIEGTEVLRRLRADPAANQIPIIAITSHAMVGDRERLIEAGCDGYLEKPIDPVKIIAQIEKILGDRM